MKHCKHCGIPLTDNFYKSKPNTCKSCVKARARQWAKDNPERRKRSNKADHSRNRDERNWKCKERKYGISRGEYEALLQSQDGYCAVCSETENLYIDHDHHTGEVRGLLCAKCNTMLGMSDDSPSRLMAGAQYLLDRGHYGPQ